MGNPKPQSNFVPSRVQPGDILPSAWYWRCHLFRNRRLFVSKRFFLFHKRLRGFRLFGADVVGLFVSALLRFQIVFPRHIESRLRRLRAEEFVAIERILKILERDLAPISTIQFPTTTACPFCAASTASTLGTFTNAAMHASSARKSTTRRPPRSSISVPA